MFLDMFVNQINQLASRWADLGDALQQLAGAIKERAEADKKTIPPSLNEIANPKPEGSPEGLQATIGQFEPRSGFVNQLLDAAETVSVRSRTDPTKVLGVADLLLKLRGHFDNALNLLKISPSPATPSSIKDKYDEQFDGGPLADFAQLAEKEICDGHIEDLSKFIDESLFEIDALLGGGGAPDKPNISQRESIQGIRQSVENLSSYPLLLLDGTPSARSTSSDRSGGGGGTAAISLQRSVETALKEVLGRLPKPRDTRSFVAALTQSFEVQEVQGHTELVWRARAYSGQTDLGGGVTGGQASLYARARVALDNALPLLDGIESLIEDPDEEEVHAARSIVRTTFMKIVEELGVEGGPRVARVETLFEQLIGEKGSNGEVSDDEFAKRGLGFLQQTLGLFEANVLTLDEETNLTRFVSLRDYVQSVRDSWDTFNSTLLGRDLGTRLVQLSRALDVAAETVGEIEAAMDSVNVGLAERQVIKFRDDLGREMTISELLTWVVDFARYEAPDLIREGGKRGAGEIVPTASQLVKLVDRLRFVTTNNDALPGLNHPRVQFPLRELRGHLGIINEVAGRVRAV